MKLIIGLTGQIASGKGTAAQYFSEKYDAKIVKFSDVLREILKILDQEISRDNVQILSTSIRKTFGEDVLARAVAKRIEGMDGDIIVVDGVRRLDDFKFLQNNPFFKLVAIEADIHIRYDRITNRRENVDDERKTFDQFVVEHNYETELSIKSVEEKADLKINNDGDMDDLHRQLDELIEKYR